MLCHRVGVGLPPIFPGSNSVFLLPIIFPCKFSKICYTAYEIFILFSAAPSIGASFGRAVSPVPNYYAHQLFGRQVLSQLSPELQEELREGQAAFELGCYGPDPLFCGTPLQRRVGLGMHYRSVRPVAQRLLEAVQEGQPYARAYAAGFLTHFALDSCCHRYIEHQMAQGLCHTAMETELDRALLLADGLDPMEDNALPKLDLPDELLLTVARAAYPGLSPLGIGLCYQSFRHLCRLQTRLAGGRFRRAIGHLDGGPLLLQKLTGAILPRSPEPIYDETTQQLCRLLDQEVLPTAQQIELFFHLAQEHLPLPGWYDSPFEGSAAIQLSQ